MNFNSEDLNERRYSFSSNDRASFRREIRRIISDANDMVETHFLVAVVLSGMDDLDPTDNTYVVRLLDQKAAAIAMTQLGWQKEPTL